MSKKLVFIAYFLDEEDGVASQRSSFLLSLLKKENIEIEILTKHSSIKEGFYAKVCWLVESIKILLRKNKLIYISCGPFWYLPFVLLSSMISCNKIIVDFRDAWSLNIATGYGTGICHSKIKLILSQWIEKFMYKRCIKFLVCTYGMKNEYKKLFGDDSKIEVILNGHRILGENLQYNLNSKDAATFDIVCIGKFLSYTTIEKGRKILEKLEKEMKCRNIVYKIHFIGTDKITEQQFRDKENVMIHNKMSYRETINFIANFNMGLCIVRDEKIEYGTKIYDYIGLGMPVYDCFEKNSMFREQFKKYILKNIDERISISGEDRIKFHRESRMKVLVKEIMEA